MTKPIFVRELSVAEQRMIMIHAEKYLFDGTFCQ